MDPNASSAQNAQNYVSSPQSVDAKQVKPTASASTTPIQSGQNQLNRTPVSVPGSIEEGSAVVMQENPDVEDDEDEIRVAPQETKNQAVSQQGNTVDSQEELVSVSPSVPEFEGSPEVEKIVEKTPDQENPIISQEVKKAGVTHSGPGIIDVAPDAFPAEILPVSYYDAVEEEKQTKLHESKHWLMGMIVYLWRKINPNIDEKTKKNISDNPSTAVQELHSGNEVVNNELE